MQLTSAEILSQENRRGKVSILLTSQKQWGAGSWGSRKALWKWQCNAFSPGWRDVLGVTEGWLRRCAALACVANEQDCLTGPTHATFTHTTSIHTYSLTSLPLCGINPTLTLCLTGLRETCWVFVGEVNLGLFACEAHAMGVQMLYISKSRTVAICLVMNLFSQKFKHSS